jgi:hypothetical protein
MATASAGYVLLDVFAPKILQYCNHAPTIMIRSQALDTVIDLCNKSLILKKSPSSIALEEDVGSYSLKYAGNRYRTIAIDVAKHENNEQPMIRTTEREMDGEFGNWRKTENSKPTRYFLEDETNKIRFWPTPNADIDDNDVEIICRVTYKRDQTEIDEFIYEKWHDVIQAGVIAKMLIIPGATWYNPQLAGTFARAFSRGIREARKTTLTGTGKYPGRVIPQNFTVQGSNAINRSGSWV